MEKSNRTTTLQWASEAATTNATTKHTVFTKEVVIGSTVTVMIIITGCCSVSCFVLFLRSNKSIIGNSIRSLYRCWRNVWYRVTGRTPPQTEGPYSSASITDQPVESESVSFSARQSLFSRLYRPLRPLPPTPPDVPPRSSLGQGPYDVIRHTEERLSDTTSNKINVFTSDTLADSAGDNPECSNKSTGIIVTSSSGEGLSNPSTLSIIDEREAATSAEAGLEVEIQSCMQIQTGRDLPIPKGGSPMPLTENEVTDDGFSSDSSVPDYVDGPTGRNLGYDLEISRPILYEGNDVPRDASPVRADATNADNVPSSDSSPTTFGLVEAMKPDFDRICRHWYDNGVMEAAMPVVGDRIKFDFHGSHYYSNERFAKKVSSGEQGQQATTSQPIMIINGIPALGPTTCIAGIPAQLESLQKLMKTVLLQVEMANWARSSKT